MSLHTDFRVALNAIQSPNPGYEGGTRTKFDILDHLGSGTTVNLADQKHSSVRSLGTSANEDVDLRALTDGQGTTLTGLTEVVALIIYADSANGGPLRVKPSASNGWAAFLNGSTNYIIVQPGTALILYCPLDGKYAVGASTKAFNVENTYAGTVSYQLHVIGRSA
jgi:hypothetical protein